MKDEIKEILNFLKDKDDYIEEYGYEYKRISLEHTKLLLDYITNLQDRIKELETINEEHRKLNGTLHEELDKYKNIVDKALCFLEATERITNNPLNDENNFERLWINYHEDRIENIDKLASILKGEDKE